MDNNTFGVLGTGEERTLEDMKLQDVFNCQRATNLLYPPGDGIGVIGSNNEQRSETDTTLQKDYGCVREGYRMPETVQMLEPRSSYDMNMLKQFNVGCGESYDTLQGRRIARDRRESYIPVKPVVRSFVCKGCGCQGGCGCPNCPYRVRENYGAVGLTDGHPYNTSSRVRYLPLR
jgi:hypothetical protein